MLFTNASQDLLLHEVCAVGDHDKLEELGGFIRNGKMDVNTKDEDWGLRTAIHWTALNGHAKCTKLLLEYGADPASKMVGGWTPAHCAAENGRLNVLKVLVDNDAPVTLPDNSGDTPKRIAEIYGHQPCVELLNSIEDSKVQRQFRLKDMLRKAGRTSVVERPLPTHLLKLAPKHLAKDNGQPD